MGLLFKWLRVDAHVNDDDGDGDDNANGTGDGDGIVNAISWTIWIP